MATIHSSTERKQEPHGMSGTPEYHAWDAMKRRCNAPACDFYYLYGERGITVCPEWSSFSQFLADMGARPSAKHSLGRIDNELGYFKANCRWETRDQQNRNTRRTKMLTHNGKTQCLKDWATEYGIDNNMLKYRLNHGWSMEEALTLPACSRNSNYCLISYNGKTQTVSAWAREVGIDFRVLFYRLNHGWSIEDALTTPLRDWGPGRKKLS